MREYQCWGLWSLLGMGCLPLLQVRDKIVQLMREEVYSPIPENHGVLNKSWLDPKIAYEHEHIHYKLCQEFEKAKRTSDYNHTDLVGASLRVS